MAKERFGERFIDRVPVVSTLKSSLIQRELRRELTREIGECLAFFQKQPSIRGQDEVVTVKSFRVTVGKTTDGDLFFEETVFPRAGTAIPYRKRITIKGDKAIEERFSLTDFYYDKDEKKPRPIHFIQQPIKREGREEIIYKIRNITPSYAEYLSKRKKPT